MISLLFNGENLKSSLKLLNLTGYSFLKEGWRWSGLKNVIKAPNFKMDLNRFLGYPWAGGYFVGPGFHVVPPDPWTHHISILNSLDSGNPNKDMHCTVNNNAILVCMGKAGLRFHISKRVNPDQYF